MLGTSRGGVNEATPARSLKPPAVRPARSWGTAVLRRPLAALFVKQACHRGALGPRRPAVALVEGLLRGAPPERGKPLGVRATRPRAEKERGADEGVRGDARGHAGLADAREGHPAQPRVAGLERLPQERGPPGGRARHEDGVALPQGLGPLQHHPADVLGQLLLPLAAHLRADAPSLAGLLVVGPLRASLLAADGVAPARPVLLHAAAPIEDARGEVPRAQEKNRMASLALASGAEGAADAQANASDHAVDGNRTV
mmetsp:Transcript_116153/g.308970  ORF Transcript_116153/g.308970 Transcript_116153/m.308970 type:complete len:257 (-) Transcript_116153:463-1233(-)